MYTIKTPKTRDEFKAYYALRYKVLREPWGHPKGTEKDDYEPISEHFMALNEKGEVVGAAKLYEKSEGMGNISHLVVATEHQHKGIGHLLLSTVEQRAREHGFQSHRNDGACDSNRLFRTCWIPHCRNSHASLGDHALGLDGKGVIVGLE
ncbi:MAG: GNAT family N-acetyltransferase [Anaerolineales bacterium]